MNSYKSVNDAIGIPRIKSSNKIINYSSPELYKYSNDIDGIVDKVIINFIIILMYLFSAIEEIDWNIYSTQNSDNEFLIKEDPTWQISHFIDNFLLHKIKVFNKNLYLKLENK